VGEGTALTERITTEDWQFHLGHLRRYAWAAKFVDYRDVINDIACGIGYGALFLQHAAFYNGYDRPGVPAPQFSTFGSFYEVDLNSPDWKPSPADVTLCFETLEHVDNPERLAEKIMRATTSTIIVSVPVVPTKHINAHHKHDFTAMQVPGLFHEFSIADEWAQPEELSHVWRFER
jgi:hypothetical protein